LYDIYLVMPWRTIPVVRDEFGAVIAGAWIWPTGILYLGLPLEATRRYLTAVREAGGSGVIVPACYRIPNIDPQAGQRLAQAEFERRRKPGRTYGDISRARDDFLWWEYRVADLEAQAAGMVPGAIVICIDKLDGHVRTQQEYDAWGRLSD
jgi:hypothetical protein